MMEASAKTLGAVELKGDDTTNFLASGWCLGPSGMLSCGKLENTGNTVYLSRRRTRNGLYVQP